MSLICLCHSCPQLLSEGNSIHTLSHILFSFVVPRQIMTMLERAMPALLADHMTSKMLEAQTKVLSNREIQREYFTRKLKEIREQESMRQSLMRKMRTIRKSSSGDDFFQTIQTEHNPVNVSSE